MSYVFDRFSEAVEIIIRPEKYVPLNDELMRALESMLKQAEQNNLDEAGQYDRHPQGIRNIAKEMVKSGLRYRWTVFDHVKTWERLTPREQQVAAYVCLGYTNQQIARKLVIATSTVKSHVRSVLAKFGLNGKLELKTVLSDWDFSEWDDDWN